MDGERRLFYVAVTRAERVLMYIAEPDEWGDAPSRFLGEMALGSYRPFAPTGSDPISCRSLGPHDHIDNYFSSSYWGAPNRTIACGTSSRTKGGSELR
jgi:hypothetical protein